MFSSNEEGLRKEGCREKDAGAGEGAFVELSEIEGVLRMRMAYMCMCVAGGWWVGVSAVNLDVTDRKTVADHYHKSDKR